MWDGRVDGEGPRDHRRSPAQAVDATTGHAQGPRHRAGSYRRSSTSRWALFDRTVARSRGRQSDSPRGHGGGRHSSRQSFCVGINDPLGMLPADAGRVCHGVPRARHQGVQSVRAWETSRQSGRAIARGQALFNTRGVRDRRCRRPERRSRRPGLRSVQSGTCTVCHDTPNAGNHSVAMPLNIGVADASRRDGGLAALHAAEIEPPATRCRPPIRGARWSPANGRTSASSKGRSCAASPRARRISKRFGGDAGGRHRLLRQALQHPPHGS